MAEQIPYGVASNLITTLASLAFKEIASIYGIKSEIEWLKETAEDIKSVLADADNKQNTDQLIQRWITKLKKVLYEADDLLDDLHTQHLLRNRDPKGKGKKVREFFSSSNPIVSRHKIALEIRNIRKKFDAVAETTSKLNLDKRVVVEMKHEKSNWRETSSKHEENIIGRLGNKKDIIDLLLNHNNDSSQNVSLVAVVGIGGLGKTALAQLVFNDADVKSFFAKRIWVCVSQDFDVKALVKLILESLLDKKEEDQPLELLQNKVLRNLGGQKFLLVLDDIWNEDPEKWLHLKKFLMCGAEGSKILLTTRNQAVANVMGVERPYVLKGLTHVQSWTLFKRLAFDKDKLMTENLESIGQKIAQKCAGVPLAIRVMGSLLRTKSRESDWEVILKGDFWKLHEGNNDSIMPILKLSYDSLTIELKQCFAYCSLYPKGWLYEKEELIDLWMVNGFLENEDEKKCLEDIGEEYVRILLMKSFLQDVEKDALGEITRFKMHDLMHDLSQSIAGSDYCLYLEGRKNVVGYPLHASFEEYNSNGSLNISNLCRLRTILEIKGKHGRNPVNLFVFKCLRSLNLSLCSMRVLPQSIGKLRHLRYLNLCNCIELTCLPRSISDLVNLQTLILKRCGKLEFSVDIITKLINLRRLDIQGCRAFKNGMPIGLCRMTTLQNLSNFFVCDDDKEREKAKLNELKELNLKGRLTIEKLGSVRNVEKELKDVNLREKKNLISLYLNWGFDSMMNGNDAMQLLENLCPHENLKKLSVNEYPGVCLSDWLLSCRNLVQLDFSHMRNCQYLIALEELVSLKTFHIQGMDKLEYIYYKGCSSSTNFFPSLEKLFIWGCKRLRGWVREENVQNARDNKWHYSLPSFPRLSLLNISHCPELSCMPTFPNLMEHLRLNDSSLKPLLDTLNVTTIGPSTSNHMPASLLSCRNLVQLSFSSVRNCQYLIALEELVSLKTFHIKAMDKLEYIYYKGCSSSTNFFPSLEKLFISGCKRLRGWVREENVQNARDNKWHHSLPSFLRLSSLHIYACPELSCVPTFPNLVEDLTLTDSSLKPLLDTLNVTTIGPSTSNHMPASLSMLKTLSIERIDLEALPEEWMQNLSSLKSLSIWGFSSLDEPFRHMRNLCAMLENFTIGEIDSCGANEDYKLQCQDLCCLHSLKSISICSCSHLVALPEWICDLHSLRFSEVNFCSSLKSFPERMSHLKNLQTLKVDGSPTLKERCQRGTGAEWPKIAHIPTIWINGDKI